MNLTICIYALFRKSHISHDDKEVVYSGLNLRPNRVVPWPGFAESVESGQGTS